MPGRSAAPGGTTAATHQRRTAINATHLKPAGSRATRNTVVPGTLRQAPA
ncbi:hypothetical protein KNN17_19575 [Arthrobacter bambusae]|nr:hypothetical protein [Arthrobacter bambusae]MCI0143771.1 hypothetical protein [Arthrobacter bambusae]